LGRKKHEGFLIKMHELPRSRNVQVQRQGRGETRERHRKRRENLRARTKKGESTDLQDAVDWTPEPSGKYNAA